MKLLVVLSVIFAVSIAAPLDSAKPDSNTQKKRSIGHEVYTTAFYQPIAEARAVYTVPTVYVPPSAVSHQSRVDVHTSEPAVVSTGAAIVASEPTVVSTGPAVVAARVVAPATTVYTGSSAVPHQSRVDVKTSPAVITEHLVQPTYVESAPTFIETSPAFVGARSYYVAPETVLYSGASAVSHQSRFDVHSSPAVVADKLVYGPSVYTTAW